MKKIRIIRLAFPFLAGLILVSCSGLFHSASGDEFATVTIDLGSAVQGQTIVPDVESLVDSYEVTLGRTGFADRTASGPSGPFTFDSVEIGEWTVVVHALDVDRIVGVGSGSIDVTASGPNMATIPVSPRQDGTGTLDITFTWPSGLVTDVERAEITQTPGGSPTDITSDLSIDGDTASYDTTDLESAAYDVHIVLGLTGERSLPYSEIVHVYDNVTTTGTIAITEDEIGTPPAAPNALNATAISTSAIVLAWSDNTDIEDGFRIQRAPTSGGPYAEVGTVSYSTTSYTDNGLTADTTYSYQVVAYNDYGDSDPSNEASATTFDGTPGSDRIIADHSVVDLYATIPQYWIDQVKTMLVVIPGESHGRGIIYGLELLAHQDTRFAVDPSWSGAPEGPTTDHLRIARSFWNGSSWHDWGGEEDFWTNESARTAMRANFDYMRDTQSNPIDVLGFGWCWDTTWINGPQGGTDPVYGVRWSGSTVGGPDGNRPWGLDDGDASLTGNSVSLQTYLDAVDGYNAHDPGSSVTFFSTGPVDRDSSALSPANSEASYARYLKHQAIRDYVTANGGVLFDYADILSWDGGEQYTETWNGHPYPTGDPDLATGGTGYDGNNPSVHERADGASHISEEACLRLGKAMWWMLARTAGWDGNP